MTPPDDAYGIREIWNPDGVRDTIYRLGQEDEVSKDRYYEHIKRMKNEVKEASGLLSDLIEIVGQCL